MEIKGRLALISKKVQKCNRLADIGTDHEYIPVKAIIDEKCENAIASDIKKGPIQRASKNVIKYGLENKIELRLGPGLKPYVEGECDVIVISGMGGILISEILEEDISIARKADYLILQPMYTSEILREWLYNNGFDILDEELVAEGHRYYIVITTHYTGKIKEDEALYYHIGRKLFEKNDPLLKSYLKKTINKYDKIISGIASSEVPDVKRLEYCNELITAMKTHYNNI